MPLIKEQYILKLALALIRSLDSENMSPSDEKLAEIHTSAEVIYKQSTTSNDKGLNPVLKRVLGEGEHQSSQLPVSMLLFGSTATDW